MPVNHTTFTLGGRLLATTASLLGLCQGQYVPKSQGLSDPESAIQFVTDSADFWKSSQDLERGGFYTDVDREGHPTGERKTVLTQSRHAFGFSKAFMLTGGNRDGLGFQSGQVGLLPRLRAFGSGIDGARGTFRH